MSHTPKTHASGTATPNSYKQGDVFELPELPTLEVLSIEPAGTTSEQPEVKQQAAKRGARFWLIFLALSFALFLSPLELVRRLKSQMVSILTVGAIDLSVDGVTYYSARSQQRQ